MPQTPSSTPRFPNAPPVTSNNGCRNDVRHTRAISHTAGLLGVQESGVEAAVGAALPKVKPRGARWAAKARRPATRPDQAACPVMRRVDSRPGLVDYDFQN